MALKATIYKVLLQIADMDRQLYADHGRTLARHPSETDERMMIRLLAFALNVPATEDNGVLEFGKDMWDADEPALLQQDLTGRIGHWIDVGQPDERRILKSAPRAERVTVISFSHSTPVWWKGLEARITRARNVAVWQIETEQSQALAALAQRSMQLQVTVQDGVVWIGEGERSVEVRPVRLNA